MFFYRLSNRAHGGSLGASADQTALLSFYLQNRLAEPAFPGQTVSNFFGALLVVLDALLLASFRSWFFEVAFYLLLEPLGVDFELPSGPSHPRKPSFYFVKRIFLIKRRL